LVVLYARFDVQPPATVYVVLKPRWGEPLCRVYADWLARTGFADTIPGMDDYCDGKPGRVAGE
jgi:hypothetical protein